MERRLDHVAIAVNRIDDVLIQYFRDLNFTLLRDETLPSVGVRLVYLDGGSGSSMIQLVQPLGDGPIRAFLDERGEGLHHLCFAVPDLAAYLEELQIDPRPKVSLGGRNRLCCFLHEAPGGLRIELTEFDEYVPPGEVREKLVILDDDPTGTQTVSGVGVILAPSMEAYRGFFASADRAVYVLTNTRAVTERAAVELLAQIKSDVTSIAEEFGASVAFLLRGDSTLRGHVFAEIDVFAETDSVCLFVPAFPEGGRTTVGGIHYLENKEGKVPVNQTEFSKDPVFAYTSESITDWVAEVGNGRSAISIPLDQYRRNGASVITTALAQSAPGTVIVPDAETAEDLKLIAEGLADAERQGKKVAVRSAASFAAIRAGLEPRTVAKEDLAVDGPVLLVCGSHTAAASRQLEQLAKYAGEPVVISTERVMSDREGSAEEAIWMAAGQIIDRLNRYRFAAITTERTRLAQHGHLEAGARMMHALTSVVSLVSNNCAAVIAKGGITSAQVATDGLSANKARVLGQLAPGISLWELRQKDGGRTIPYGVVPGNVGDDQTLVEIAAMFGVDRTTQS